MRSMPPVGGMVAGSSPVSPTMKKESREGSFSILERGCRSMPPVDGAGLWGWWGKSRVEPRNPLHQRGAVYTIGA